MKDITRSMVYELTPSCWEAGHFQQTSRKLTAIERSQWYLNYADWFSILKFAIPSAPVQPKHSHAISLKIWVHLPFSTQTLRSSYTKGERLSRVREWEAIWCIWPQTCKSEVVS